ncbi:MAG: hypothetical protein LLG20_13055 [Acidobacteriales bacterium]|nr:hypothetical protein [Terriglobales bacterium]
MTGKRCLLYAALFAISAAGRAAAENGRANPQSQNAAVTPFHIYKHFFASVVTLKAKAEELARQGNGTTRLRSIYRDRAQLSQVQADQLEAVAVQCESELQRQNTRAREIILASRAKYPGGRLVVGEQLPPPPVELLELQKGKEEIVLRARERLRQAFGDQEFARLEQFLAANVAPRIQVFSLDSVVKVLRSQRLSGSIVHPNNSSVR